MTYREQLQKDIAMLQQVYDNANYLRDCSFSEEQKSNLNKVRQHLPTIWAYLMDIDNNQLTDAQANSEI